MILSFMGRVTYSVLLIGCYWHASRRSIFHFTSVDSTTVMESPLQVALRQNNTEIAKLLTAASICEGGKILIVIFTRNYLPNLYLKCHIKINITAPDIEYLPSQQNNHFHWRSLRQGTRILCDWSAIISNDDTLKIMNIGDTHFVLTMILFMLFRHTGYL